MSDLIDREAVAAAKALFDTGQPSDEAYADTTPVTVTLTRGDAFQLRGAIRGYASDFLRNIEMVDDFGVVPTQDQANDTNQALSAAVRVDTVLAAVADVADFPRAEAEPELVGM